MILQKRILPIMHLVTSSCVLKKNMAVCQNNSNNCSKCRVDFMVYRSQTESLIWKFTHFFTTISSWFSLRTGKKAKFHISQWNQRFCEVEYKFLDLRFNKTFLIIQSLKFQRVHSSVHKLQIQPLKVFDSIVYQYKGT